jgi:hypothetical protein
MSSGDKGSLKYNGTEDLEDDLSSVRGGSGHLKMASKSSNQDLEDILKGGLRSSKVLEGKLNKLGSLKNVTNELPVKEEINGKETNGE